MHDDQVVHGRLVEAQHSEHGRTDTAAHVLQRFTPAEREILPTLISDAADATTMVMTEGVAAAQRVYHTRKP